MTQLTNQQLTSLQGGGCYGDAIDTIWGFSCGAAVLGGPIGAAIFGPTCGGLAIGAAAGACR